MNEWIVKNSPGKVGVATSCWRGVVLLGVLFLFLFLFFPLSFFIWWDSSSRVWDMCDLWLLNNCTISSLMPSMNDGIDSTKGLSSMLLNILWSSPGAITLIKWKGSCTAKMFPSFLAIFRFSTIILFFLRFIFHFGEHCITTAYSREQNEHTETRWHTHEHMNER